MRKWTLRSDKVESCLGGEVCKESGPLLIGLRVSRCFYSLVGKAHAFSLFDYGSIPSRQKIFSGIFPCTLHEIP